MNITQQMLMFRKRSAELPATDLVGHWEITDGLLDTIGISIATPKPGRGYTGACTVAITGLLTTDTIAADSTDKPTCGTNGVLTIAAGAVVYGVTITRSGVVIGYYPCAEGAGNRCFNRHGSLPHGTISSSAVHTPLYNGVGFDLNLSGYSPNYRMVRNYDFRSGKGSWSIQGLWSFATNKLHCQGESASSTIIVPGFVLGVSYTVSVNVANYVSGSIKIYIGLGTPSSALTGNGVKTFTGICANNTNLYLAPSSFVGDITSVEIYPTVGCNVPAAPNTSLKNAGTVVCVGDSITSLYCPYIATLLDGYIVNSGVPGSLVAAVLSAYPGSVVDYAPNYALLMAGVNDAKAGGSAASIISGLTSCIALHTSTGTQVILGTITPFKGYTWDTSKQAVLEEVNTWIKNTSGVPYVDHYTALVTDGDYTLQTQYDSGDHLHPNAAGLAVIANGFANAITALDINTDANGDTIQYPGPIKLSIQGDAGSYYWPSSPMLQLRTGVNNAVFNADGTAKTFASTTLALAAIATVADDTYLFAGTKAAALYSSDMSAQAAKIKKIVGA